MSRGWLIEIEYSLTAGPYQSPVNDSLKAKINFEGGEEEILYIAKCVCVCLCVCICVDTRTGHQSAPWLYFILANEEAASVLLGHSGNMHSEVTSKAG